MFEELRALLETLEFEESGRLQIFEANWQGERCRLSLMARYDAEDVPSQVWQLTCGSTRSSRLGNDAAYGLELFAEHPLLLPFRERHVKLGFKGSPADPYAVLGRLLDTHHDAVGSWIGFEEFLNTELPLAELLASGSGLLADGPKALLARYAEALSAHGIQPALLNEREPTRWAHGQWLPERTDLEVLLIGESFLIGADFHAERIL